MKTAFTLLISLLILLSCQQEEIVPTPGFSYGFANEVLSDYLSVYPNHEAIKFTNTSAKSESYRWDFGDGTTSTEKEPIHSYEKPGTYTVSLTSVSETGEERVATKSITIGRRVLKAVTIRSLTWNALGNLPNWPANKAVDLQLEIGQRAPTDPPTAPSTIVFRSEIAKNVTPTNAPLAIPINSQYALDNPLPDVYSMIVNLYGIGSTGKTLIYSSGASGAVLSRGLAPGTTHSSIEAVFNETRIILDFDFQ